VLLFLLQAISGLIESVYVLQLLSTSLDEKALGVLVLLSPFFLFFVARQGAGTALWVAGSLLVMARIALPYLDTRGRLLAGGLATGAGLVLLPLMLAAEPPARTRSSYRGLSAGQGVALAVGLSTLLRTWGITMDVSLSIAGAGLGWVLGFLLLGLLRMFSWDMPTSPSEASEDVFVGGLGTIAVLGLVYFTFASPGVIARWIQGGDNYPWIVSAVSTLALGWCALAWWRPNLFIELRRGWLALWNGIFILALVGALLAGRVTFPATPQSPLVLVAGPTWLQQMPLLFVCLLFPVIFVDLPALVRGIAGRRVPPKQLALGFGFGSLLFLILIFANIFTNVWGYVPPVSTGFRNQYWFSHTALAAIMSLTAILRAKPRSSSAPAPAWRSIWTTLALTVLLVATIVPAWRTGRITADPNPGKRLTILTYNIQQGIDDKGQLAHQRQLALMRQLDPDLIALQESDSARISLGNKDLPRYYGHHLGYYVYYGPPTVAGTFGTAILSRYPLEATRVIYSYSDQDEIGTAVAEINVSGRRFRIYNVHPDGSRAAKLGMVDAVLDDAADAQHVIVLGDFNARPETASYGRLAGRYTNAWRAAHPTESNLDRIDHIFLSAGLEVLDAVYLPPPASASDHPAHWATVVW
jgi:endonuclease/exonuclease/phosphatase family metal-dependent hydrolase